MKQGLNPFTALLKNGNEYVSTSSALLTISATDLVVPGRGGMDLVISRYYNSKAPDGEENKGDILEIGWMYGFPSVSTARVNFPNGSVCDVQSLDLIKQNISKDGISGTRYINSNFLLIKLIGLFKLLLRVMI